MKNRRDINDLQPHVAKLARELVKRCGEELPIDRLAVTSTLRDLAYQSHLFAQGRTAPGKIVTNARAGYSWHNFGLAFDVVPIVAGVAFWDNRTKSGIQLWTDIGSIGEELGLEWGGRWTRFPDMPHFQLTAGRTLAQLRAEAGIA